MLLPSDFEKLPSLPEFRQMLDMLKKNSFNGATFEQIQNVCFTYLPFLPRMTTYIHFEESNDKPFFRVRLNINSEKEDLNLIRTYSYPSVNYCTVNGRANMSGKTVFYCSDSAIAAICESKPKAGDIGFLSIWDNKITKPLSTALYLPNKFPNPNPFQTVANEAYEHAEKYYDQHGQNKSEHLKILNRFIADIFVTENNPYPLSSFLSHSALYGDQPKDLILYPSIASESYQCNFAIHPNIVERYLSFRKVIRFKILEIDSIRIIKFSTGKNNVGELIGDCFMWRDSTDEEKSQLQNIRSNLL